MDSILSCLSSCLPCLSPPPSNPPRRPITDTPLPPPRPNSKKSLHFSSVSVLRSNSPDPEPTSRKHLPPPSLASAAQSNPKQPLSTEMDMDALIEEALKLYEQNGRKMPQTEEMFQLARRFDHLNSQERQACTSSSVPPYEHANLTVPDDFLSIYYQGLKVVSTSKKVMDLVFQPQTTCVTLLGKMKVGKSFLTQLFAHGQLSHQGYGSHTRGINVIPLEEEGVVICDVEGADTPLIPVENNSSARPSPASTLGNDELNQYYDRKRISLVYEKILDYLTTHRILVLRDELTLSDQEQSSHLIDQSSTDGKPLYIVHNSHQRTATEFLEYIQKIQTTFGPIDSETLSADVPTIFKINQVTHIILGRHNDGPTCEKNLATLKELKRLISEPSQQASTTIATAFDKAMKSLEFYLLITGGHPLVKDSQEASAAPPSNDPTQASAALSPPNYRPVLLRESHTEASLQLRPEEGSHFVSRNELQENLAPLPMNYDEGTFTKIACSVQTIKEINSKSTYLQISYHLPNLFSQNPTARATLIAALQKPISLQDDSLEADFDDLDSPSCNQHIILTSAPQKNSWTAPQLMLTINLLAAGQSIELSSPYVNGRVLKNTRLNRFSDGGSLIISKDSHASLLRPIKIKEIRSNLQNVNPQVIYTANGMLVITIPQS